MSEQLNQHTAPAPITEPQIEKPQRLISIKNLFKLSWQRYARNRGNLSGIIFFSFLPLLLFAGLTNTFVMSDGAWVVGPMISELSLGMLVIYLIAIVAFLLLSIWGEIALTFAVGHEGTGIKQAFKATQGRILSYIWTQVLAAFVVLIGFVLFFIPGVIFSVWFILVENVFIFENLSGRKALSRSKSLVKGRWWVTVGRLLPLIIFYLPFVAAQGNNFWYAGTASLVLTALITPIIKSYLYEFYLSAKQNHESNQVQPA